MVGEVKLHSLFQNTRAEVSAYFHSIGLGAIQAEEITRGDPWPWDLHGRGISITWTQVYPLIVFELKMRTNLEKACGNKKIA